MAGWVKLYRDITSHWIFSDAKKFKWWIDILLSVNHADGKVVIGNQLIECKRGQSVMSLDSWASRWKTSRHSVTNFFNLLEKDSMLVREALGPTTRITVCNYEIYQGSGADSEHDRSETGTTAEPTAAYKQEIINNKKNNKNKEVHMNIPFEAFWRVYPRKQGPKKTARRRWEALSDGERQKIMETLPAFLASINEKKFIPYPATYLNQERWNDEIIAEDKRVFNPETGMYVKQK